MPKLPKKKNSANRKKSSKKKSVAKRSTSAAFQRTRADHATEAGEDYVELIDDLLRMSGEARLVDIAEHLGVSHVSASRVLARLQREGLVETKPYRAIFLTEAGKRLAVESRRRHELVVNLLRAIGVPEHQAQIDAEGIEHHISDTTLKTIARFLKTGTG